MRYLFVILCLIGLVGCDDASDTLKIGGKEFSESTILSEMIAALAEDSGIAVTRRTNLGSTLVNLEALKRGEIDIYPEYNGTGLVMLGQPAMSDGNAAMERVRSLYQPLGLAWSDRFGFANNYGLAMRADRADELGITSISGLVAHADGLTIGIEADFQTRPLDGFEPMTARYGMQFDAVNAVPLEDRTSLYDSLLDGSADVIEVYTTDGQLADLNLLLLEDDLQFFPVYQAAALVRADALVRFPELQTVLNRLAGKLDAATMQRLNSQVDRDTLAPGDVARAALAEMGLLDTGDELDISEPVLIAHSPFISSDPEERTALRAVRSAYPGRRVLLQERTDPLAAVGSGDVPIAMVAAVEFADLQNDGSLLTRPFEAFGVVGQAYVHIVGRGNIRNLSEVEVLATGPVGSASHRTAQIIATAFDAMTVTPVNDLAGADADAILIIAPIGSPIVQDMLQNGSLLAINGWDSGNNLVRFPQLRQARIPSDSYDGQTGTTETLASQLVLAGPVVVDTDAVGPQGPGASIPTEVAALSDRTVRALHQALGQTIGLDPAIRAAPALAPMLPAPPAAVNPSPAVSVMTALVFIMFGWLIWLYMRPERR
ncbi:glycine betaine ABC transporter substrate-binding protein [Pseudaestuariivita rosea]|uniref:glycine betaine ABC transporter substrate-binding protein n=1 Tax=Pseudaestuariivita rosea TaxID=2763263 RepID=UPI001ABA210C|nr:glycine betaine ABC transporter substrate-binding protein [Pseudaestuariivita rosea]